MKTSAIFVILFIEEMTMRDLFIIRRLATAIIASIILIYFMTITPSPKIIFIPFLFCGIASIGKNLGLLFKKKRLAVFCDKLFKYSFFIFWFGFLFAASYFMIRDNNERMLPYTIPFWIAGIFFAYRKLLKTKNK